MTQARSQLVDPTQAGTFHCVNRCVRRSWLCGLDNYTGKSFEHRRSWVTILVKARILELGDIFACGVHAWAVMSNHLHIVVHISLRAGKVAGSYPRASYFVRVLFRNAALCAQLRRSNILALWWLSSTSFPRRLMKSLSEPIARKANADDNVTGRF